MWLWCLLAQINADSWLDITSADQGATSSAVTTPLAEGNIVSSPTASPTTCLKGLIFSSSETLQVIYAATGNSGSIPLDVDVGSPVANEPPVPNSTNSFSRTLWAYTTSSNNYVQILCGDGLVSFALQCQRQNNNNCAAIQLQCGPPANVDLWRLSSSATLTVVPVTTGTPPTALCPTDSVMVGIEVADSDGPIPKLHIVCNPIQYRICDAGYQMQSGTCNGILCDDSLAVTWSQYGSLTYTNSRIYPSTVTYSCLAGYTVQGASTRTCATDGSWAGVQPTCLGVACADPPSTSNCDPPVYNTANNRYPSRANYSCYPGYSTLQNYKDCMTNGQWPTPPTCTGVSCAALSAPSNGVVMLTSSRYPATANYSCNTGYTLSANVVRYCQTNGLWNASAPICTIKSCGAFPSGSVPTYSTISYSNGQVYNSAVTITCNAGYCTTSTGSSGCTTTFASLLCQANGQWQSFSGSCYGVVCPVVSTPANGAVIYTYNRVYGTMASSIASYSCSAGMQPAVSNTPQPTRTCQTTGTWSGADPICLGNLCASLASSSTSSYVLTNGGVYPCTATYTCFAGYTTTNPLLLTCQSNTYWDKSPPICVGITCASAPSSLNAQVSVTNSGVYPSSAVYQCNSGYVQQSTTRVCQTNGTWVGPFPNCVGVLCSTLANPTYGSVAVTNGGRYPSNATYSCNAGYYPTLTLRTCQQTGLWTDSDPYCQGVTCAIPPDIQYGTPQVTSPTYPSTLSYACDSGYSLVGSSQSCLPSGAWGGSSPTCSGSSCATLPSPVNGSVTRSNGGAYPSTATYSCKTGFVLSGSATRDCSSNLQWLGTAPTCVGIPCNALSNTASLVVGTKSNGGLYPSTAPLSCQPNYYASPAMGTATCASNGAWTLGLTCVLRNISLISIVSKGVPVFASMKGGELVVMTGTFGSTPPTSITYGSYSCRNITGNATTVTCRNVIGVGAGLMVSVAYAELGGITLTGPSISYPAPAITNYVKFLSLPNPTGVPYDLKSSGTRGGDVVYFPGINFGYSPSQVQVTYGTGSQTYQCLLNQTMMTNNLIVCSTVPGDSTSPLYFTVSVGGQLSNKSGNGYEYADGPTIINAAGCQNQVGIEMVGCPTDGGIAVWVSGTNFDFGRNSSNFTSPIVNVGGVNAAVLRWNESFVFFNLPPGTGSDILVTVYSGEHSTPSLPLISYAAATVNHVTGCTGLKDCARVGGDLLVIQGINFGASGAGILIAGAGLCLNVVHDRNTPNQLLTCNLPPGKGAGLSMAFLQLGGAISFPTSTVFSLSYKACAAGTYENVTGINCVNCAVGYFTSATNQASCVQCPAGTFTNQLGTFDCSPAQPGFFIGQQGSTNQTPCPPGYFSASTESTACSQCAPGRYTNGPGNRACTGCAPGKFQSQTGQTACTNCSFGMISASASASCVNCPPGTFAPSVGLSSCNACTLGYYTSFGAASVCLQCNAGTYGPDIGASSCLQCGAGTYTTAKGNTSCNPCPAGRYQGSMGMTYCGQCQKGTIAAGNGASACSNCLQGTFSNVSGGITCPKCDPGTYSNAQQRTSCLPCDVGRFAALSGSQACSSCLAGAAASAPGSTGCTACTVGTYSSSDGASICSLCQQGRYADGIGIQNCIPCQPGSFANNTGTVNCALCSLGRHAAETAQTACGMCTMGTYAGTLGSHDCVACDKGTYMDSIGQSVCTQCIPGKAVGESGATTCVECTAGTFTVNPIVCSECLPGTFTNLTGQSGCQDCTPGTFSYVSGQIQCDACNAGRYTESMRTTSCSDCSLGTVSPDAGMSVCTSCSPGTMGISSSTCGPCDPGRYSKSYGQSACALCSPGTASSQPGLAACDKCTPGRYSEVPGRSMCVDCPPGTFSSALSATSCNLCSLGRYSNSSALSSCLVCQPGTSAPITGMQQCQDCTPGTFAPYTEVAHCLRCQPGTATNLSAQTICQDCAPGFYAASDGQDTCSLCPLGKYAYGTRTVTCADCPPGTHGNESGLASCWPCPPGQFTSVSGGQTCSPCRPGTHTAAQYAATCDSCSVGTYSDREGAVYCTLCEPGRFQGTSQQTSCDYCQPGTFSSAGLFACSVCDADRVAPWVGSSTCYFCDSNAVATEQRTDCICASGYFAAKRSTNDTTLACAACPEGAVCSSPGVTDATLTTAAGYWRQNTNSLEFFKCVFPGWCNGGRNSTCGPARQGPVCSLCMPGYTSSGSGKSGVCKLCPQKVAYSWLATVFILIAFIFGLFSLYMIVLFSDRDHVKLIEERQAEAMKRKQEHGYDWGVVLEESTQSHNNNTTTTTIREQRSKRIDIFDMEILTEESRVRPNATYKMKILVGFLQIATNLAIVIDVPWPSGFKTFISYFNFVNLDFVPWQSVGCVTELSYFQKLWVITAIPLVVFALLILFYVIPLYIFDRLDLSDVDAYRRRRERARMKFWKLTLFSFFLMYPYVSSSILKMYVCYNIDGIRYLVADFNIHCGSPAWRKMIPYSVVMIIIYPFGIPAIFWMLLWRSRKRLLDVKVMLSLGFLYNAYCIDMWYFEMLDLLNKLFLTSILAFFPDHVQMPFGMTWCVVFIMVILAKKPYIRKGDDRLHLFVMTEIFLLVLCAWVLRELQIPMGGLMDGFMSAVLIIITCSMMVLFVVMAFRNLKKIFYNIRRRQEKKRQRLQSGMTSLNLSGGLPNNSGGVGGGGPGSMTQLDRSESDLGMSQLRQ